MNSCVKSEQGPEDESDGSLPRGWQEVNTKLVSPEGKSFASRASAVKYWMIKNRRELEEIYVIWSHLEKKGWELGATSTLLLPAGWRIKLSGIQDWHFLSRWSQFLIPDNIFEK